MPRLTTLNNKIDLVDVQIPGDSRGDLISRQQYLNLKEVYNDTGDNLMCIAQENESLQASLQRETQNRLNLQKCADDLQLYKSLAESKLKCAKSLVRDTRESFGTLKSDFQTLRDDHAQFKNEVGNLANSVQFKTKLQTLILKIDCQRQSTIKRPTKYASSNSSELVSRNLNETPNKQSSVISTTSPKKPNTGTKSSTSTTSSGDKEKSKLNKINKILAADLTKCEAENSKLVLENKKLQEALKQSQQAECPGCFAAGRQINLLEENLVEANQQKINCQKKFDMHIDENNARTDQLMLDAKCHNKMLRKFELKQQEAQAQADRYKRDLDAKGDPVDLSQLRDENAQLKTSLEESEKLAESREKVLSEEKSQNSQLTSANQQLLDVTETLKLTNRQLVDNANLIKTQFVDCLRNTRVELMRMRNDFWDLRTTLLNEMPGRLEEFERSTEAIRSFTAASQQEFHILTRKVYNLDSNLETIIGNYFREYQNDREENVRLKAELAARAEQSMNRIALVVTSDAECSTHLPSRLNEANLQQANLSKEANSSTNDCASKHAVIQELQSEIISLQEKVVEQVDTIENLRQQTEDMAKNQQQEIYRKLGEFLQQKTNT